MADLSQVQVLDFPLHGDERGRLVVVEGMKDIPFEIKRLFYIYGSDRDIVRGTHANRKSRFVLINVAGSSKVKAKDGLGNEKIVVLDKPNIGVYLPTMVWKDMYDFSEDSVLLVLSNEPYDAAEYIRDYDEFCRIVAAETKGSRNMANLEKYNEIFTRLFDIDESALNEEFTFAAVDKWDSLLHLTLVSELEDSFDIMLETDDILHFGGYCNGKKILEKHGVNFGA